MISKYLAQEWIILESHALELFQRLLALQAGPMEAGLRERAGAAADGKRPKRDAYGDEIEQMTLREGIAVVPIHGALVQGASGFEKFCAGVRSHEDVHADLDRAENAVDSGEARGILLEMKSPGGTVAGTPELAARIQQLAGRMAVASFNGDLSASAAEYLSAAAAPRFATPSSTNGSIGVILQRVSLVGRLEQMGIEVTTFTSGKLKAAANPYKPLTEGDASYLQGRTDALGVEFRAWMQSHRPGLTSDSMEGQVFTGRQALANGLIDALEPNQRAVLRAL